MRVAYRGEGPLVVKLAGMAGGIGLYEEEMSAAAGAGFRVAALDTTGDRRDDPDPVPGGWDGFAREVVAAIDGAHVPAGILWGTSFGCMVALATAARYPERVRGLLLSHPPFDRSPGRLYTLLRRWALRTPRPTDAMRAAFSIWFLSATSWELIAPPLWARLLALRRAAREAATPAGTVRSKVELLFAEPPGLPPAGVRVEVIAGTGDLVAPHAGAVALAARLPGSRLHVMPWSGHAGAYARPRMYRELALAALARLSDASP